MERADRSPANRAGGNRMILLAAFALLVLLRLPNVWLQGRFFGEEGTYFLGNAWHAGAWQALWRPLGGYLNVVATGSTSLAVALVKGGILPLELAPYVTIVISFLIQLVPAIVLLTSPDAWLARHWVRPIALLMIAASPFTQEVWLHSLHAQFHLALASVLILACAIPSGAWARGWRLAVLFVAPLTGPGAIVALPFFIAKAIVEQSRERTAQAGALLAGTAIQLAAFYTPSPVRGAGLGLDDLSATLIVRHVIQPFTSPSVSAMAGEAATGALAQPGFSWAMFAAGVIVFGALGLFVLRRWRESFAWLIAPGLAIAAASYWGGISTAAMLLKPGAGMRYTFVPQVLICLGALYLASGADGAARRIARVLVGLNLFISILFFTVQGEQFNHGPDWRDEVARWRAVPAYQPEVWPGGEWRVDLSAGNPPCTARPTPSWCNEHWEAKEREWLRQQSAPDQR